jgi:hypothetical protein
MAGVCARAAGARLVSSHPLLKKRCIVYELGGEMLTNNLLLRAELGPLIFLLHIRNEHGQGSILIVNRASYDSLIRTYCLDFARSLTSLALEVMGQQAL